MERCGTSVDSHAIHIDGKQEVVYLLHHRWPPVTTLQLASVFDQLNLIELSSQILEYYIREVTSPNISDVLGVDPNFIREISGTLSRRNRMKDILIEKTCAKLSEPISPTAGASTDAGLDKFRRKLKKILMFKSRSRKGEYTSYSPVLDSSEEEEESKRSCDDWLAGDASPVGQYLKAKRRSDTPDHNIEPEIRKNEKQRSNFRDAEVSCTLPISEDRICPVVSEDSESSMEFEIEATYEHIPNSPPPVRKDLGRNRHRSYRNDQVTGITDWATAAQADLDQVLTQ
jgi:hypothetical protein